MVVLDLDGTLLNDDKEISPLNIKALKYLRKLHIEVVVATGRRYRFAKSLFENIGFPLTILCSSGTMVRNTADDIKIMSTCLETDLFHDIVRTGRRYSLRPLLHVDRSQEGYDFLLELEKDAPCYKSYLSGNIKEYLVVPDFTEYSEGGVLLMCFMGEEDVLRNFQARIREKHGSMLHCHILTTLKRIGPVLEIMNPLGTKWNALVNYARDLAISPGEIVAMGDDGNDIEMIKNSGLGIAMKNATDAVKSEARAITLYSNNEDGVARALSGVFNIDL